jgi:hypothetical protein
MLSSLGQLQRDYLWYPVLADVLVVADSFFCAQAPKVKALAATATIKIALTNFNVYRLLSLRVAPPV